MKNTKVNVSFEVGSEKVREIGVRERDTVRWKLEKRDRSTFLERGGKREKVGEKQADIVSFFFFF